MYRILLLLIIGASYFTLNATETVVKVKAPEYEGVNVLKSNSSDLVFAGTWGSGVYISSDGGANFQAQNNGLNSLYINDIAFDSQENVYVGTQGDGIFKSTNDGNLWVRLDFNTNLNVTSVYVSPFDDNTVYAGTYGSGLHYSTDGGATWSDISRPSENNGLNSVLESRHITAISITPDSTILVGTYGDGAYRAEILSYSWRNANSGTNTTGTGSTEFINQFEVIDNNTILMATNDNGLFESDNAGLLWSQYQPLADSLKGKQITSFVYTDDGAVVGTKMHGIWYYNPLPVTDWLPSNLRRFGVVDIIKLSDGTLLAYNYDRGLIRNTVGDGKYWENISLPTRDSESYITSIVDDFVLNINDKMFITDDLGETWTELTNYTGGMVNRLKYTRGQLIAVKDNIVSLSANKGQSWANTTPGDGNDVMIDFTIAPNDDMYAFILFVDDGMPPTVRQELHKSTDGGNNWTRIQNYADESSSVGFLVTSPSGDIYMYRQSGQNQDNKVYKSTDAGASFQETGYSADERIFDMQFTSGNLYLGTGDGLYVSKDNGVSFSKLNIEMAPRDAISSQPQQVVESMAIGSANDIYVGLTRNWGVYHTTNGGTEWDSLHTGYNSGTVHSMAISSKRDLMFTSKLLYKYLNGNTMGSPALTTPENEAMNQPLDLTFDWESIGKADLYQFQISANDAFFFSYEEVITSDTEHQIFYEMAPSTEYFWRVRGKSGGVFGPWSPTYSFTTIIGPPTLIEPAKDTISVVHTPTFLWHSVEDAENYKLYVATDSLLNDIVLTKTMLEDTTYTLTEDEKLNPLTKYYWAAAVQSEDGSEGQLSEIWMFRTGLGAPILISPENNDVNLPEDVMFTWNSVQEAVNYQFQASRLADFSVPIADGIVVDTLQNLPDLEFNVNYYWRVRATDTNNVKGPWSEIWTFKTGQERPIHISPANNSGGQPLTVTLDWTDIDEYEYDVQFNDSPDFESGSLILNTTSIESEYEVIDLENNKTYYWRVRSRLDDTLSAWTEPWNFSTGLARTVLNLPENGADELDKKEVVVRWFKTDGADSYKVQVSRNDSFTNLFVEDSLGDTDRLPLNDLESGQTYHWRVKAYDEGLSNDWSEVWTFTISPETSVLFADDNGISIYPNPAKDEVTLSIPNEIFSTVDNVLIINQTGEELKNLQLNSSVQPLNLSDIPSGTYYIIINSEKERYLFKLNKVK
jgi:photosystem II stability/assembly factor-like uncharacterized protein